MAVGRYGLALSYVLVACAHGSNATAGERSLPSCDSPDTLVDNELLEAIFACEPPGPEETSCWPSHVVTLGLPEDPDAERRCVRPRSPQQFTRKDGTSLEIITRAELDRRLKPQPDQYMGVIGVRLIPVDETTWDIGVLPGIVRYSDRVKGISVGLSGCPLLRYDVIRKGDGWACGNRAKRIAETPRCKELKQKLDSQLASLRSCEPGGACVEYHCRRVSMQQVESVGAIEDELAEAGCEVPANDCGTGH